MFRDINSKGFLLGKLNRKSSHLHSPCWNCSPRSAQLRPILAVEHLSLKAEVRPWAREQSSLTPMSPEKLSSLTAWAWKGNGSR